MLDISVRNQAPHETLHDAFHDATPLRLLQAANGAHNAVQASAALARELSQEGQGLAVAD